jgi:hypothetical protein
MGGCPQFRDAAIVKMAEMPPPEGQRRWTAKLIAGRLVGIPWQHFGRVIKAVTIDLRSGRRRKYLY